MRQSACLVVNPIMVDNYAAFFNCTPVCRDGIDLKLFILNSWLGKEQLSVAWLTGVQLVFLFCSGVSKLLGSQESPSSGSLLNL